MVERTPAATGESQLFPAIFVDESGYVTMRVARTQEGMRREIARHGASMHTVACPGMPELDAYLLFTTVYDMHRPGDSPEEIVQWIRKEVALCAGTAEKPDAPRTALPRWAYVEG